MNVTVNRRNADLVLLITALTAAVSTVVTYLVYGLVVCGLWVAVSSLAFWAVETRRARARAAVRYLPVTQP